MMILNGSTKEVYPPNRGRAGTHLPAGRVLSRILYTGAESSSMWNSEVATRTTHDVDMIIPCKSMTTWSLKAARRRRLMLSMQRASQTGINLITHRITHNKMWPYA